MQSFFIEEKLIVILFSWNIKTAFLQHICSMIVFHTLFSDTCKSIHFLLMLNLLHEWREHWVCVNRAQNCLSICAILRRPFFFSDCANASVYLILFRFVTFLDFLFVAKHLTLGCVLRGFPSTRKGIGNSTPFRWMELLTKLAFVFLRNFWSSAWDVSVFDVGAWKWLEQTRRSVNETFCGVDASLVPSSDIHLIRGIGMRAYNNWVCLWP